MPWQRIATILAVLTSTAALIGFLWSSGFMPATNGLVEEAKAQVQLEVAGLEKFSKGTRILTLQGDRRYYQGRLDRARTNLSRDPGNQVMRAAVRDLENTLREINHQIEQLRR